MACMIVYMPLSGGMATAWNDDQFILWWCGVGYLNYFIYHHYCRIYFGFNGGPNPEFLGHKVEAREVKIAAIITVVISHF